MIIDKAFNQLILFYFGGMCYVGIELIARGYSHWTMFILGGACFLLIGLINEYIPCEMPLTVQMMIGCVIITVLEFVTGYIVNILLGWEIWDYSNETWNLCGQICLKYSVYWYFLSVVAIVLDDFLRWIVFEEEKPRYKIF